MPQIIDVVHAVYCRIIYHVGVYPHRICPVYHFIIQFRCISMQQYIPCDQSANRHIVLRESRLLSKDQTEIILVQCTHAVPVLLHVSLDLAFQVLDRCMKFPHISCHFEFLRVPFTLLLMLVTSSIPAAEAVGTVHVTSLTFYG